MFAVEVAMEMTLTNAQLRSLHAEGSRGPLERLFEPDPSTVPG
jgi:hypothetical protein